MNLGWLPQEQLWEGKVGQDWERMTALTLLGAKEKCWTHWECGHQNGSSWQSVHHGDQTGNWMHSHIGSQEVRVFAVDGWKNCTTSSCWKGKRGLHVMGSILMRKYKEVRGSSCFQCFHEKQCVGSKCSAMRGLGLVLNLTTKIFQLERSLLFWVPQINDKRGKEEQKGAFLRIFASASSSVRTRTFFHKSQVLDIWELAVTLELGTITMWQAVSIFPISRSLQCAWSMGFCGEGRCQDKCGHSLWHHETCGLHRHNSKRRKRVRQDTGVFDAEYFQQTAESAFSELPDCSTLCAECVDSQKLLKVLSANCWN